MLRLLFRCIIDVLNQICFYCSANLKPAYLAILYPASCYWIPLWYLSSSKNMDSFHKTHSCRSFEAQKPCHADVTLELMDTIRPLNDERAACLGFTNSRDQKPANSASLLHLISQKSWFCWAACAPTCECRGIPASPTQFHLTSSWKCQIVSRLVSCTTRSCVQVWLW